MPVDRVKALAYQFEPLVVTAERGRLAFFARATGQADPAYADLEAAKAAGHHDLPIPPTFYFSLELERPDPFGWLTALRERRKIDSVYVFALGVKPDYQHTGVAARFYQMHFDAAESTPQKGGEMGWILEVNKPMNRAMEGMGGKIKRRYRVYERAL